MKIAYVTSGAAGTICGSCMRDNTLTATLTELGHDCLLIPTYTPIRTDEPDVSLDEVYFGGITIYLEQKSALFRHVPEFLDRWLSHPRLLNWVASRYGIKTRPEDLGAMTISMLKGNSGFQRRDVLRITRWLASEVRPDVVCLTNALISGIVPELKGRLGVPIVCTLQGDDIYLEWLPEPYRTEAKNLIQKNCELVDAFITTSAYYADFMTDYLGLPRDKMDVVLPGIRLDGFNAGRSARDDGQVRIGYLARICPEKGLHVLVDAFRQLRRMPDLPRLRLCVAGFCGPRDQPYLDKLLTEIEAEGWKDQVEFVGEVDHAGKLAFLRSLDVFSVPTTYREPKGLYVLEAWAAGLPVVQPRHGSFPELIAATGGGVLFEPGSSHELASSLRRMIIDPAERRLLGERARSKVQDHFHARRMALDSLAVFETCRATNAHLSHS